MIELISLKALILTKILTKIHMDVDALNTSNF